MVHRQKTKMAMENHSCFNWTKHLQNCCCLSIVMLVFGMLYASSSTGLNGLDLLEALPQQMFDRPLHWAAKQGHVVHDSKMSKSVARNMLVNPPELVPMSSLSAICCDCWCFFRTW